MLTWGGDIHEHDDETSPGNIHQAMRAFNSFDCGVRGEEPTDRDGLGGCRGSMFAALLTAAALVGLGVGWMTCGLVNRLVDWIVGP